MYKHYFFNTSVDKHYRHEVHTEDCSYLPSIDNRMYIGFESSCSNAIDRANKEHPTKAFDGCFWCCRECNKG